MKPFFVLVFGDKADIFLDFKQEVANASDEDINEYYETLADKFIDRETDLNRQCLDFIRQSVEGTNVLDVACGAGFLSRELAAAGHDVTGADIIVPEQTGANPSYQKALITGLPFGDNQFDTVICTHTLEHIKDIKAALKEVERVCKKRLIIVVPCQREYTYTFDLHLHFFPYEYKLRELVGPDGSICKLGGDFLFMRDFP